MAPTPVTFPHRRFVVTRLDGAVETNVFQSTALANNYSTDQGFREGVMDNVRTIIAQNPGVVVLIYGPTNGGNHTDGDRIWDSRVSDPL